MHLYDDEPVSLFIEHLKLLSGVAAEERKMQEWNQRGRGGHYNYQPDESQGSEFMSIVGDQSYPKVDRLELPHSSSEDEVCLLLFYFIYEGARLSSVERKSSVRNFLCTFSLRYDLCNIESGDIGGILI